MQDIRFHTGSAAVLPLRPAIAGLPACPQQRAECEGCRMRGNCVATVGMEGVKGGGQLLVGRRRLANGQTLFREGRPFAYLYALRFGTLKTSFTLDDGREQVTGFYFAGDVLGLDALAHGRYPTHAVALEDSEVCLLPFDELVRLAGSSGTVAPAVRLAQLAAGELLRDHMAKAFTSLRNAEPRVAAFLLMLSRRMRQAGQSGTDFELRMSRAEIGSYLGLTLESVSRAFSAFAAEGWLAVRKRSVRILSMPSLEAMCHAVGSVVQGTAFMPPAELEPCAA